MTLKVYIIIKHLVMWSLIILLLSSSSLVWGWTLSNKYDTLIPQIYGAVTNAIIFYTTSFFLIPAFYNRQRKAAFTYWSIALVTLISLSELWIDAHLGTHYQNKTYLSALDLSKLNYWIDGLVYILPINILYYLMAFVYRVPIDRRIMLERTFKIEQEKLKTELNYLKAQVHPHTLFNGMNSIYHLIDTHPQKAKDLVLNLSNALRYHLYESTAAFTALSKELNYLNQYIALNTARIEEDAIVKIEIDDFEGDYQIAPLLLTPFIENAFKYVSHFTEKEKNLIVIKIKILENNLIFLCTNSIDQIEIQQSKGGLGLKNVRDRLNLIYGDQYNLQVDKKTNNFEIHLQLPLKEYHETTALSSS